MMFPSSDSDSLTIKAPSSTAPASAQSQMSERLSKEKPPPSAGSEAEMNRTPGRRNKGTRRRKDRKNEGASSPGFSLVWKVLSFGVLISFLDAVYIFGFVERQNVSGVDYLGKDAPIAHPQESNPSQQKPDPIIGKNVEPSKIIGKSMPYNEIEEKARVIKLLTAAGIPVDFNKDKELIHDLPSWADVVHLYGPRPVIHGLENCQRFQNQSDPADHFVSTAGTFNSGTNLMAELLIANCRMQARMDKYGFQNRGVRWQVPWGKHTPPGDEEFRTSHKTLKDANVDANNILPAVTIRDPMFWLGSMCKHQYSARWDRGDDSHCPDFSPRNKKTSVKYAEFYKYHDSIVHMWNDWYNEYLNVKFPNLIVRFEDLVFHPEEVTKTVCECAGGSMRKDGRFQYIVQSAKKGVGAHGSNRTGYVDAIVKYGTERRRYDNFPVASDIEYIRDNLDKDLMRMMNYKFPDPARAQKRVPH